MLLLRSYLFHKFKILMAFACAVFDVSDTQNFSSRQRLSYFPLFIGFEGKISYSVGRTGLYDVYHCHARLADGRFEGGAACQLAISTKR